MQNEEKLIRWQIHFFSLKYVETKEEEMIFTCHKKFKLGFVSINGGIR